MSKAKPKTEPKIETVEPTDCGEDCLKLQERNAELNEQVDKLIDNCAELSEKNEFLADQNKNLTESVELAEQQIKELHSKLIQSSDKSPVTAQPGTKAKPLYTGGRNAK